MEISQIDSSLATQPEIVNSGENTKVDQMDFLRLLTVQLANQDPLNPMDNSEFVSQQATFAQLEQLMNLNGKMEEFIDSQGGVLEGVASVFNTLESASFLGKNVAFFTNDVVVGEDGNGTALYYDLTEDALVEYTVVDEYGHTVRHEDPQLVNAGEKNALGFDFRDNEGNVLPAGQYTVKLSVSTLDGRVMTGQAYADEHVVSIDYRKGTPTLELDDGRKLGLSDVIALLEPGEEGE